jgi:hypothetical protein
MNEGGEGRFITPALDPRARLEGIGETSSRIDAPCRTHQTGNRSEGNVDSVSTLAPSGEMKVSLNCSRHFRRLCVLTTLSGVCLQPTQLLNVQIPYLRGE